MNSTSDFFYIPLKTHCLYQPLFHILIQELSQLIVDKRQREIFYSISSGEPISRVSARHKMTYEETVAAYGSLLEKLGENAGRIASFREQAMTIQFGKYGTKDPTDINVYSIFHDRAGHILHQNKIQTLRQLLKYTSRHGWSSLKSMKGLGVQTYKDMIHALYHANFIQISKEGNITLSPALAAFIPG